MEIEKLVELIKNGVDQNRQQQVWADLGAGSGAFTQALSSLLMEGSKIYAVDKDSYSLNIISIESTIEFIKLNRDFGKELQFDELLDGIILANSLHYIHDKTSLLKSLRSKLATNGRVIVVEYDIAIGNRWVPFPITSDELGTLARNVGFHNVVKLGEIPSQYHSSMYSALLF
jgi:ubiquinone/menaquinone biosynthesis C-methylase UbiE